MQGTKSSSGSTNAGWYGNYDYLTYAAANFGTAGTIDGIRINYAEDNQCGRVGVRLGDGTTGQLIGEFKPTSTQG